MTDLEGSVALVTGGSRGIGAALVAELFTRGAAKVYATARDPRTVTHPDAVPLALELADPGSAAAIRDAAPDVTILVNNAGAISRTSFLESPLEDIRREFEVNFFGPLFVTRAFVPVLERNGGGHVLTIHSALSWFTMPGLDAYSAAKAALWSQTNALRLALRPRGIAVTGLHVAFVDTELAAGVDGPKTSPRDVARRALDGIEGDALEVIVDEVTRDLKAGLAGDPSVLYPEFA
jgi:NAD(P)-dependent dehydrogenase (short-subunit alcohol dehydrogenase family)